MVVQPVGQTKVNSDWGKCPVSRWRILECVEGLTLPDLLCTAPVSSPFLLPNSKTGFNQNTFLGRIWEFGITSGECPLFVGIHAEATTHPGGLEERREGQIKLEECHC